MENMLVINAKNKEYLSKETETISFRKNEKPETENTI